MPNDFQKNNLSTQRTTTMASRALLLFQTVRFSAQDFRQRRPEVNSGCICIVRGTKRLLFRSSQVLREQIADAEWRA